MRDILKIMKGFETLNDYFNKEKVIDGIIELIMEDKIFED